MSEAAFDPRAAEASLGAYLPDGAAEGVEAGEILGSLGAPKAAPGERPRHSDGETLSVSPWTQGAVADRVCDGALRGAFTHTESAGWLHWTGTVWRPVSETRVSEVVRLWGLSEAERFASEGRADALRGITPLQGSRWREGVVSTCRGIMMDNLSRYDADADRITAANGILNLRTGALTPHHPSALFTKETHTRYVPGATDPAFTQALRAVPEDARDWLQLRLGQALTGHIPDDAAVIFMQGGGRNGKSTLLDVVSAAMGDYAFQVPDSLVVGDAKAHPTELMSVRGVRCATIEETPEARHLNVQRVKKLAGTERITARAMYRDFEVFRASHSLFVTTNYFPQVAETDFGTWRRLAILKFPYRFVTPGTEAAGDLPGDSTLKSRLATDSARAAALAWLVEGAQRWYAAGCIMPPHVKRVQSDTRLWRAQNDIIASFTEAALTPDPDSIIPCAVMLEAFNSYAESHGQRHWSDATFTARFAEHEVARENRVEKKRTRVYEGRFSCPEDASYSIPAGPTTVWVGLRFADNFDTLDKGLDSLGVRSVHGSGESPLRSSLGEFVQTHAHYAHPPICNGLRGEFSTDSENPDENVTPADENVTPADENVTPEGVATFATPSEGDGDAGVVEL